MARGTKHCDPPSHGNHMHHFEEAMEDALNRWNGGSEKTVEVTFQATVSPNPGGVREYIVVVADG